MFAFSSVAIRDAEAFEIIRKARAENPVQMPELKASKLLATDRGKKLIGALLAAIAQPDADGRALLARAAERLGLSARAWHRTLKVARTLADLDGSDAVRRLHIAEALSYRRSQPRNALAA